MKVDYHTYKRASNVSLLGLAIQFVLGLTLLLFAVIFRHHAALTGALYVLSGTIVWLCLAVVFDQHRRERIEALEAEAMERSGAAGSSVFAEGDDEAKAAARRVAWMHRVLLPTVSLGIAALLIALGWWRMRSALALKVLTQDLVLTPPVGQAIFVGLVLAIVGFIFARYASGMAKQKVWATLKGGAAQSVGAAIVGIGLLIAHFALYAGSDIPFRYLHVIFPAMLMVLGVEIVLNFVLTMYRPRRPGEMPKPAFESQVLGFVAAPDRIAQSIGGAINYQFGFDVTSSWFYQLLSRSLTALLIVGALVIWAMTWVAVVKPNEQGLLLRGGRLVGKPLGPGIYVKWPWPIEHVEREETTTPRRLDLAGLQPGDVKSLLWTNEHKVKGGEKYLIVQPSAADKAATAKNGDEAPGGAESESTQPGTKSADEGAKAAAGPGAPMGNIALVAIEVPVIYEVVDLEKYQALAQNDQMRDSLLQGLGRREIMKYLATRSVDDVLGNGRGETSRDLINRVEDRFKGLDAGVKVLFVGIVGVHPPIDTAADFEKVVSSEQQRKGAIEAALTEQTRTLTKAVGSVELAREIVGALDALEVARARGDTEQEYIKQQQKIEDLLTRAGGEAAVKIQQAKADRWVRHMGARGRAERYTGQLLAYRSGGAVYTAQLYFDLVSGLMKSARVYIVPDGTTVPTEVRADMQEIDTGSNVFQKVRKDEDMGK